MTTSTSPCPLCRTERHPEDSLCRGCGLVFATLEPDGAAPLGPSAMLSCPECGRLLPAEAARCAGCGADVSRIAAPLRFSQSLAQGRYTIQRTLTSGGMGTIFLATDHGAFDRTVVIKVLLASAAGDAAAQADRERFLQEGRTLATLKHPAIPQIFAFFEERGRHHLVMEYVEGNDLEQGLSRADPQTNLVSVGAPYPRALVLTWGVALCRILEYLAGRQPPVVHRDIKPANIILDRHSGDVFLVDFGTAGARLLPAEGAPANGQTSAYGTPGYAAPEQYQGQSGPASDVYALAATLYHLLTDDDPRDHPFQFPRLDDLDHLTPLLEQALARDPTARPSAAQMHQDLERLLVHPPAPLAAPDGTSLNTIPQIVRWCEDNWSLARQWAPAVLPEFLANQWGQVKLAEELRDLLPASSNNDQGLDALLALLDPKGFGTASPQVTADPPLLDLRPHQGAGTCYPVVRLTNSGRRYAHVTVSPHARWFTVQPDRLVLQPGHQATLNLTVATNLLEPTTGQREGHLVLEMNGADLARVPLLLPEPLPKSTVAPLGPMPVWSRPAVAVLLLALVVLGGMVAMILWVASSTGQGL